VDKIQIHKGQAKYRAKLKSNYDLRPTRAIKDTAFMSVASPTK
jgi:hypothetical protein